MKRTTSLVPFSAGRWMICLLLAATAGRLAAHDHTLAAAGHPLAPSGRGVSLASTGPAESLPCVLALRLEDADSGQPRAGLVRITPLEPAGAPLALTGVFERPQGWYSTPPAGELRLPRGRYRVEAVAGIDTTVASAAVDFTTAARRELRLPLQRFFRPETRRLRSANTHLHLIVDDRPKMGVQLRHRKDADDYLRVVGASDGLDLIYVSYLTRPGVPYITNEYTEADFAQLSQGPTRFANGVEHRHAGRRVGPDGIPAVDGPDVAMSYGHVLLLDLMRRSMPASIGPGLTEGGRVTDGVPLRTGIIDARQQGAGVIWCHGSQGLEDVPNWVAGLIHAQNIFDGGNEGLFDTVHYPYLNAGFKVPFSTGTDWGLWDFSRVYIESPTDLSSEFFLRELAEGRTFITNEPFLEFNVGDVAPGGSVRLTAPDALRIRGRAIGRSDFIRLQVVHDGQVVRETKCRPVGRHFEAEIDAVVRVERSGWLALRISPEHRYDIRSRYSGPGTNILGKAIFAHTSAVYVEVGGRRIFEAAAGRSLLSQVRTARQSVVKHGVFASSTEQADVLRIYDEAEASLQRLLADSDRAASVTGGGEVLYNGIRLPALWPPRHGELTREPMPVPYLRAPPPVITIDVGRQLFVNADTAHGELRVEVLDRDARVLAPFTLAGCRPLVADGTRQLVEWAGAADLGALAGQPVRFRFHLRQGRLFAFWVSSDEGGASRGYFAAGGPGFNGSQDLP